MEKINTSYLNKIIKQALAEDLGPSQQDITTDTLFSHKNIFCSAEIIAKENGVMAGFLVFKKVFKFLDKNIKIQTLKKEGEIFKRGECLIKISGKLSTILKGERTALNFLQRMSGIATITHKIVSKFKGTNIKILDTRKTTPGLRILEKYAVKIGGGNNHRFGLFDGILIKDNHLIATNNDLINACQQLKNKYPQKQIEVEVQNLKQVQLATNSVAEIIMLDNMNITQIKKALALIKGKKEIEVSGIKLKQLNQLKKLKIQYISLGRLTHSIKSIDLSLEIKLVKIK